MNRTYVCDLSLIHVDDREMTCVTCTSKRRKKMEEAEIFQGYSLFQQNELRVDI